jgi:hypothetical protein
MFVRRIERAGLVAIAVLLTGAAVVPRGSASVTSAYTAAGFAPSQVALIEGALALFAEADLDLPQLDFELHTDAAACRGARGFYTGDGSTIRICTADSGGFAESLYLHEIAHAWDDHALTDDRRRAFLELRDLESWWDDGSAPWHTFGAEHAAHVVMWGLIDRPIRLATIPDSGCAELEAGYVVLTGQAPLHGFTDLC